MKLLESIVSIVSPVTNLIDNLHTSEEEKQKAKAAILRIQSGLMNDALNYEKELIKSKSEILKIEAQGQSWLQRNWRPITMMTFLILIVSDSFGLLTFRLSNEAWELLKIGLGGYVVGRSAEKIVPIFNKIIKK